MSSELQDPALLQEAIIRALKEVYDPEIPVDIYELGLIYHIEVSPTGDVKIVMTLTSAFCPAAQHLPDDVKKAVEAVPGVKSVEVEVTFDPPWEMSRMSENARIQLGLL
ncbi:MAG: SUF system Fe-S cluster assembly protein [Bacteroidia bacterium]|nr:SUF system Fe-S cluster assembly protein [Bacteroidia bacterium]MCX7763604.1 SUF system Fe-S cluster assembly protein [Bacteroidia bacterium]MDW8057502.1 SUF system Fe-S cluster assembly protein [Bacteroidia bacterium]